MKLLLAIVCLAALALHADWPVITKENAPKVQLSGQPGFSVAFAPDFTACDIPRRLMIELEFAKDFVQTEVKTPPQLRLLGSRDLTRALDKEPVRKRRRYYFETLAPADPATVEISSKGGKAAIPVVIFDYAGLRENRTVNGMAFPRRYPLGGSLPYVKTRQVHPDPAPGSVKEPVILDGFIRKRIHYNDRFTLRDFTPEEIWRIGPDTAFTVRKPFPGPADPVHGDKIYQASGDPFYPYKMTPPLPGKPDVWKLASPVDGSLIPDNNWGNVNDLSGKVFDDGINGAEFDGQRHYYIGVMAVMRGLILYDLTCQAAALYAATKDVVYAELALAGFTRIGVEHNMLSSLPQYRRSHVNIEKNRKLIEAVPFDFLGNTGFFIDGIWTTADANRLALAYDRVFPAITADRKVFDLLNDKKLPVKTPDELKRFIEENVFLTYLQGQEDGICRSNYPQAPRTFAAIARVLDYPDTRFVDKLRSDGLGENMFLGLFWRDGIKTESPGGYNNQGLSIFYNFFRITEELTAAHPELFPPEKFPRFTANTRFQAGALSQIKHATTPYTQIVLGDGPALNTFQSAKRYSRRYTGDETPEFFEAVYRDFPRPEIAWALVNTEGYKPGPGLSRAELEKAAATLPADWRVRADDLSGPGINLLRGGVGDDSRTFYSHYGHVFHGHDSVMGIYLDALNSRLVTGWGYPAKLDPWYYNWMGNNTGRHFPAMQSSGTFPRRWRAAEGDLYGESELCVKSGNVQAARDRGVFVADKTTPPIPGESRFSKSNAAEQSRTRLMVNVSPKEFYAADFYWIRGGNEHVRSFGTLDGTVEVKNLELVKQPSGTLAGPAVPYNNADFVAKNGGEGSVLGFVRIRNVERAKTSDAPFEATWHINGSDGAFLRLVCLAPGDGEIALGDAKDHHNIYPMTRRMLFWRHTPTGGKPSRVLNLLETGRGTPLIESARRLDLGSAGDAVAAEVKLKGGRIDYLVIADRPGHYRTKLEDGTELVLDGRLGLATRLPDGRSELHLLDGTRLALGKDAVTLPAASYSGVIAAVDPAASSIDVVPPFAEPANLAGRNLSIERNGPRFSLEVLRAENTGKATRLFVNCPPLADAFLVKGHGEGILKVNEAESRAWVSDLQYPRSGMVLSGVSGKRYILDLRMLKEREFRLLADDRNDLKREVLQKEFPLDSEVKVYEYAPGFKLNIPLTAEGTFTK